MMRVTANWRRLHRSYTVIFSVLLVALSAVYEHLPLLQAVLPSRGFAAISMIIGVVIAVMRYIDQPGLQQPPETHPDQVSEIDHD